MSQAIIDPEEVRRFAKELKRFNDDVQAKAGSLQADKVARSEVARSEVARSRPARFMRHTLKQVLGGRLSQR